MDAIFALAAGARARVLERAAARLPGCLYVCLWAPVSAAAGLPSSSSSHLYCLDAWIGNGAGAGRVRAVFDAYRGSFCPIVRGCVPGWAFRDGLASMELPEPDLTASVSLQVQQQFYHEAGTKMGVFMGCDSGEIEVGLSSASPAAVAHHVQQSLLEEFMQLQAAVPSSSSSSLPSLSIGSPEYSSLIRSMATTAASSLSSQPLPLHPAAVQQQPGSLPPIYGAHGHAPPFRSPEDDDAAMAQAILAVISSPEPPAAAAAAAAPRPPSSPPWLARHRAQRSSPRRGAGAFRAYSAGLSPRARPRPGAPGQRMMKTAIALLASVHAAMRDAAVLQQQEDAAQPPGPPPPAAAQHTSSQLHHMISERRRRERLNESFQTLRALLPPGTKKDKATVLANTTEYMNKLIADVSELEKKNRLLEARLSGGAPLEPHQQTAATAADDGSSERVHVDVTAGASTSTSTSREAHEVSVRVTVRAECDLSEVVVAALGRIKQMGRFAVATVDARQRSRAYAHVSITLRVVVGDDELDEASMKEAVAKAVEDAVTARPPSPPPPQQGSP